MSSKGYHESIDDLSNETRDMWTSQLSLDTF